MNPISGSAYVCTDPNTFNTFSTSASNSPNFYTWIVSPSAGVQILSPSVDTTSIIFPNVNAIYTVYCSATNNFGSSGFVSFVVNVFEKPNVTFSGNTTICQGSGTNLSASPTILAGSSTLYYTWTPSLGLSPSSGPNVYANPTVTTMYTVTTVNGPCNYFNQVTVNVDLCLSLTQYDDESNKTSVYPNPNNGIFSIKAVKSENGSIINELGQTIRNLKFTLNEQVTIEDLDAGIYFMITPTRRIKIIVTR